MPGELIDDPAVDEAERVNRIGILKRILKAVGGDLPYEFYE